MSRFHVFALFHLVSKTSSVLFGRFSWRTRTFHFVSRTFSIFPKVSIFLKLSNSYSFVSQSFNLSQTFQSFRFSKFQSFSNFPSMSFLKLSICFSPFIELSQTFPKFHDFFCFGLLGSSEGDFRMFFMAFARKKVENLLKAKRKLRRSILKICLCDLYSSDISVAAM